LLVRDDRRDYAAAMSKKFNNAICVYCATRSATTADHVVARCFFLVRSRGNLLKVPACQSCNKAKSDLEHYLATVLPFGGRHTDAAANLKNTVPQRLAKNLALHRTLTAGMSRVWTREAGVYRRALTLPFEPEKLDELFAFIAKGLAWHQWGLLVTPDTDVWAGILNGMGERLFGQEARHRQPRPRHIQLRGGAVVRQPQHDGLDVLLSTALYKARKPLPSL
jgi:ribosomal protein L40E